MPFVFTVIRKRIKATLDSVFKHIHSLLHISDVQLVPPQKWLIADEFIANQFFEGLVEIFSTIASSRSTNAFVDNEGKLGLDDI